MRSQSCNRTAIIIESSAHINENIFAINKHVKSLAFQVYPRAVAAAAPPPSFGIHNIIEHSGGGGWYTVGKRVGVKRHGIT